MKSAEKEHKESQVEELNKKSSLSQSDPTLKIKNYFQENDKYHTTDICDALFMHEFNKVKMTLGINNDDDISFLFNLAYDLLNEDYRNKYEITIKVAQIVFGEIRDQLEWFGQDTTDIIDAYDL